MKTYGNSIGTVLQSAFWIVLVSVLTGCEPAEVPAALDAPTGLGVGNPKASSLDISWNSVSGATSYELFRASSASGPWTASVHKGSEISWTDNGLTPETTYYYEVRAANSTGASPLSSPGSGTTSPIGTWKLLSLNGIPQAVANGVLWIDMHQATASGPLFLVIGSSPSGSGQNAYAFTGDDGSWTDISEAAPPRLYANTGSLVSSISPAGEPTYWYQGPDLTIGESQVRTYSGTSWAARDGSPAPSSSSGEYRNLHFKSDGTLRLLYQKYKWDTASGLYKQSIYLREFSSSWGVPAGLPDPIVAPGTKTQIPAIRAAIGPAGEVHFVIISSLDGTTATVNYYRWDGALTGPESIAATNKDTVVAIAVNPTNSQPYVLTEDVSSGTARTITAYRRTDSGWQAVGATAALSRTTFNNHSVDLAFTADGTLWASAQTSASGVTVFRFASAWEQYTWTSTGSVNYEGMRLTKDARICLFAKPTTTGQSIVIASLATW